MSIEEKLKQALYKLGICPQWAITVVFRENANFYQVVFENNTDNRCVWLGASRANVENDTDNIAKSLQEEFDDTLVNKEKAGSIMTGGAACMSIQFDANESVMRFVPASTTGLV